MGLYTPQSSLLSPGRIGQKAWYEALVPRCGAESAFMVASTYHRLAPRFGINPDLALAQACEECAWFTSDRWRKQSNPCGLGITADDVPGHRFPTPFDGMSAHIEHLCCYAYTASACPVDHGALFDFRHSFHDGNPALSHLQDDTRKWATKPGYVGRILAIANSLLPKETSMSVPKPPTTPKPSPNKGGYTTPHKPEAIVWHVTVGGAAGSLSWLTNPASNASANYLIDRTGKIYELVPPTESAWANGLLSKPDYANPVIKGWVDSGVNPNTRTVSIECERLTSANEQPGGFTSPQRNALVALSAWLCASLGIKPDRQHIIGHCSIDSVTRLHCPGIAESEWAAWVGEIAALVNPQPPAPSAMMEPVITERQDWGGKGKLIAEEVTVQNTESGKYYSQKKRYEATGVVLEGWREV